jgi:hypothetical protein
LAPLISLAEPTILFLSVNKSSFCCSYNAQQVTKFRAFRFVFGIRLGQCAASYALVRINPSALLDWCDSPIAKNMKIAYMEKMIGIYSSLR